MGSYEGVCGKLLGALKSFCVSIRKLLWSLQGALGELLGSSLDAKIIILFWTIMYTICMCQ